jgi:Holliday junction resolvasome RuvABC endonuclease subunit
MPVLPDVEFPVWGCDPSTRRVALGIVLPGRRWVSRALELGPGTVDAPKLAAARFALHGWFGSLAEEFDPGWLWVEQPFAKRQDQVPVESWLMLGVVMEAAYSATGAVANLLPPVSWKADAVGHGFASKRRVLDWARGLGFTGDCDRCDPASGKCKGAPAHDQADALGVAVAGAVFVAANTSPVRETVFE